MFTQPSSGWKLWGQSYQRSRKMIGWLSSTSGCLFSSGNTSGNLQVSSVHQEDPVLPVLGSLLWSFHKSLHGFSRFLLLRFSPPPLLRQLVHSCIFNAGRLSGNKLSHWCVLQTGDLGRLGEVFPTSIHRPAMEILSPLLRVFQHLHEWKIFVSI